MDKYEKIKELLETTDLTVLNIAKELDLGWKVIWNYLHKNYTKEFIQTRKRKSYSLSKLGDKNPQYGKQAVNFKELKEDGYGYYLTVKPDWYTGRKGSQHVFSHSVIVCQALGLTEIPKGFCIHHINGDTRDNNIHNLALVTIQGHGKFHTVKRRRNDYPKGVGPKKVRSANIKSAGIAA